MVDSARQARRVIDEVGSPALKVLMDGANIFHRGDLDRMCDYLAEAIGLVGPDIALAHAKDLDHDGDAGGRAAGPEVGWTTPPTWLSCARWGSTEPWCCIN